MHDNNFLKDSTIKIVTIHTVTPSDKHVRATITTSHFGRVTTRPYVINNSEWNEIILRGWI